MDIESATDDVWADAHHAPLGDNIASTTLSPQQVPVESSAGPIEQIVRAKNIFEDDQPAEDKSQLGPKIHKARKAIATKVWRARYALPVIFGCFCWLVLTLLMINSAAVGIRGVLMPSYRTTTHQLSSIKSEQTLLLNKFKDLQGVRLQKRPFETHPKCLTRATNLAQDHFGDLPYQSYLVVAEYTTVWAQSECDKVIFSPVPVPLNGWQSFWRAFSDHTGAAFYRCKDIIGGLLKVNNRRFKKPFGMKQVSPVSLPVGYHLDCNDVGSFCNLSFTPLQDLPTPDELSRKETELINKGRRMYQIIEVCKQVDAWVNVILWLISWINLVGLVLCLVAFSAVNLVEGIPLESNPSWTITGCFIAFYLSELVLLWMYIWHRRITEKDKHSRTITTSTYALHFGVILMCCVELATTWWAQSSTFHHLLWAFQELRAIYFETLEESIRRGAMDHNDDSNPNEDNNAATNSGGEVMDTQTAVVENDGADHASTLPDLHLSPDSPFPGDVKLMREHLHRKHAMLKLEPQAIGPEGDTLADSTNSSPSTSPNSNSGWIVLTSPGDEAAVLPNMDNSYDDYEFAEDATEATMTDDEEQPTEDAAGDNDEQSIFCRCSVCGAVGVKSMLLQCVNVDCPLTWMHSECAGIPTGDEGIKAQDALTRLCPVCGEN